VPVFTNDVIAADNCTPNEMLAILQNPEPGALVGPGTNTITITVKDEIGNANQCATSFIVTQSVDHAECQTIQDLSDRINNLDLNGRQKNELLQFLQHPGWGNDKGMYDIRLEYFINKVSQLKSKGSLNGTIADDLIKCAQWMIRRGNDHAGGNSHPQ
jgi:HYR domain